MTLSSVSTQLLLLLFLYFKNICTVWGIEREITCFDELDLIVQFLNITQNGFFFHICYRDLENAASVQNDVDKDKKSEPPKVLLMRPTVKK